jgi:hypothetical protein
VPEQDFTPLLARYPDTIARMEPIFTSHQFILKLAHANQRLYVEALYSYRDSMHRGVASPFRAVHGILSQRLHDFPDLVIYLGKVRSSNIFGESDNSARWQRQ